MTPSNQRISELHPDVALRARILVDLFKRFGLSIVVTGGRRGYVEQLGLYLKGRLLPGGVVTGTLRSKHLSGRAFDISVAGFSPDQVPDRLWRTIGRVGELLGLSWGGRFPTLKDNPHFEL